MARRALPAHTHFAAGSWMQWPHAKCAEVLQCRCACGQSQLSVFMHQAVLPIYFILAEAAVLGDEQVVCPCGILK